MAVSGPRMPPSDEGRNLLLDQRTTPLLIAKRTLEPKTDDRALEKLATSGYGSYGVISEQVENAGGKRRRLGEVEQSTCASFLTSLTTLELMSMM